MLLLLGHKFKSHSHYHHCTFRNFRTDLDFKPQPFGEPRTAYEFLKRELR